jgi:hypothetical protein
MLGGLDHDRQERCGVYHVITVRRPVPEGARAEQPMARRRAVVLTLVGLLACSAQVFAVGRSPVPAGMVLPDAFGGILSPVRQGEGSAAAIVIVSGAVLLSCWWYLLAEASAGRLSMRRTAGIVIVWLLPILVGPPLLSFDAYAYLAQGEMVAHGLDPYSTGPVALGSDPALSRVDPLWRSSLSPYGPVTLLMFRVVAMAHAGLTADVLALRLLALLGVAAAVIGAVLLSPRGRRPVVLVLTLANPVVLLHLLGGVHVDAMLAGLVVLALVALHAGRARSALLIAGVAVACKVTVLPLFLLVLLVLVRRHGVRVVWLALVALVAPFVATGLVLDRPWGFLQALFVSGSAAPWYAPASILAVILRGTAGMIGLSVGNRQAHLVGLGIVVLAGAVVVAKTFWSTWLDTGPDAPRRDLVRAGVVLLVPVLALPALFGWYLGPAVFVVAAAPFARGVRVLVILCSLLSLSSLPAMYGASPWLLALAGAIALAVCVSGARRHRRRTREAATPAGSSDPPAGDRVGRRTAARLGGLLAADGGPTSRRAPRALVTAVRAAEATVVLALVALVAMPGAQATYGNDTQRAELATRSRAVNSVADVVTVAYPDRRLAIVLARPGQRTGVTDFDVQLVATGEKPCWLRVSVPDSRLPAWVAKNPGDTPARRPSCPDPAGVAAPSTPDSRRSGPR